MSKRINPYWDELLGESSKLYPVNNVKKGQGFYFNLLLEKLLSMFIYDNVPPSLRIQFVEMSLIKNGYAVLFERGKYGLVTCDGGLSGYDNYYMPTTFTWAQPVMGSGIMTLGTNAEIIYNSSIDMVNQRGLRELLLRYSRKLADADATESNAMIWARARKVYEATSVHAQQALDAWTKQVESGKLAHIANTSTGIMNSVNDRSSSAGDNYGELLTKLSALKKDIIAQFFEELGVKYARVKRAEMSASEVASGNQPLLVNTFDFLACRKEGVKRINALFNTEIEVHLNPIYDVVEQESEVMQYDDENDSTIY